MVWLLLVIQAWRIGIPTIGLIAINEEHERLWIGSPTTCKFLN